MHNKLLDPLDFYQTEGREAHSRLVQETFERHLQEAGVDARENQLLAQAYETSAQACRELRRSRGFRIFFGVVAALVLVLGIGFVLSYEEGPAYWICGICLMLAGGAWLFAGVIPSVRSLGEQLAEKTAEAEQLLGPPAEQLDRLSRCFDPGEGRAMVEQVVPEFHFHDVCTRQHQLLLEQCDYRHAADSSTSVTDTLAGDYRGHPFLFTTVRQHAMRDHVYTGSKTIYWEEEELQQVRKERTYTDSDGHLQTEYEYVWEYVTVQKEETLRASVTAPVPHYSETSSLGYGHPLAPNLHFSRQPKHIQRKSEQSIQSRVSGKGRALRSKSERAVKKGEGFLMMANEEFEVLFGATDRDNDHQFRVMFTPQAQTNMVALLKDSTLIGDEFAFHKCGRYNIIPCSPELLRDSPVRYHDYSVEAARQSCQEHQEAFFRGMFGVFAPLLAIPGYHESAGVRTLPAAEGHLADCQHEAVANCFPRGQLATEDCETEVILKTRLLGTRGAADLVEVTAYGYTTRNRVETFRMKGGDGYWHDVDVDWVEYLPRVKTTAIAIEPKTEKEQSGGIRCRGLYAHIIT